MRFFFGLIPVIALLTVSCSQQLTSEEYIDKGQEYVAKEDWKSAVIEFRNAVKVSPDNPEARTLLGKTYVKFHNGNAAIKELTRAIDLGANIKDIMIPLGKAYRQGNQHQKIIDQIMPAEGETNGIQADIYSLRAMAFLGLDNKVAALQALKKARNLDEDSIETRLAWARYEKSSGNVAAQLKWLKPLREKDGGIAEAWSLIGEIELDANNLEAAEKAYSRSIDLRPYAHIDLVRRAGVRITGEDYNGAKADISMLKKFGAKWSVIDHMEGLIAYQLEKYDDAQSHFNNALSKSPDYAPSQLMLGLTHYRKNNIQSAFEHLEQYLSVHPDGFQPNYIFASTLLKQNKSKKAIVILRKLQKKEPENITVLSLLANAYISQKKSETAIELLTKAVNIQPDNAQLRLQLGTVLLAKPSTVKSGQQQLNKAIKLSPDLHQADFTLFVSYMREKRYDDARLIGQQLDSKQKQQSQGANMIALSYLGDAKKSKAIKQLQDTLNRFPNDIATSDILARIYLQQDENQKARDIYENIIKDKPNNLKSLNQLALIAAKEGHPGEVIQWLQKAQERNPDLASPKILLSTQYLRQKEFAKAIQVLADVNDEQKQQPGYVLMMAQAKIATKEYQHAIRLLKSLISRKPKLSAAHYLLAQAYGNQKEAELMRRYLESTIKIAPEHLSANIVLAKLDLFEGDFDSFKKRVKFLDTNFSENQEVQLLKAKLASGNKNYTKAIDTLSSLMGEAPRSEIIIDLSRNQWQAGDRESAISGLELWIQDHSEDVRAIMLLAQFYLAENRFEQAKESYAKLDSQLPDNPVVLNNLAWLMKDSDPVQGIKYAKKALSLVPDNPYIKDTLAMLYLQNGDNTNALRFSEEAANAEPGFLEIQLNYATILNKNNFKSKAQNRLRKLLANANSDDEKQLIQERLATISNS